jgi:hypothetical protein
VEDVNRGPDGLCDGWYVDPLGPLGRRRWWTDGAWTARVAGPGLDEGISWRPGLADLPRPPVAPPLFGAPARGVSTSAPIEPDLSELIDERSVPAAALPPIRWYAPGYEPRPEPVATPAPVWLPAPTPAPVPSPVPVPLLAVPEPAPVAPDVELSAARPRARRRVVASLVAAAVIVGAASATAIRVIPGPEIEPVTTYRDGDAGFALHYPDRWAIGDEDRGESIRFDIAAPRAGSLQTNSVRVTVGPPPIETDLDALVAEVTPALRAQFPGIRLERAGRTTVAGGPGYELEFVDVNHTPRIRVRQIVGTTTSGDQLLVNVTIREPRTAPTDDELRDFVRSIRSV